MRLRRVAVVFACAGLTAACGKRSAEATPPTASSESGSTRGGDARAAGALSASAQGSARAPAIGGTFAVVGGFAVELAMHRAGLVEARVMTPDGTLVPNAKLSVSVPARGGESESISLAFVSSRARFEGHARAGVELRSGPVEITLSSDDDVSKGRLALALALEPPRLGGSVLAAGAFGVEALALATGDVFALVRTREGLLASGDLEVDATLTTRAGAIESVKLTFEPARALFVGKCGAGVSLAPGRFGIRIRAGNSVHMGALAHLDLSTQAASEVSGKVNARAELAGGAALGSASVGAASVGAAAAQAVASARVAAPKVALTAPKVQVDAKKDAKAGTGAKASAGFSFGTK